MNYDLPALRSNRWFIMNNMNEFQKKFCQAVSELPSVPAESFFQAIHDLNTSARLLCLIIASVNLRIFDELNSWKRPEEIESMIRNPHLTPIIIQSLIHNGYLEERDGKIKNTRFADVFLSYDSPYFQGGYLKKINNHLKELWIPLDDIVKSGPVSYDEGVYFSEISLPSMAENSLCGRLQRVTKEITELPSFHRMKRMLDLGGGHGLYAIAAACKNPHLSAIVFDLPGVTGLADRYIQKYSMESQVITRAGNFFYDPIGRDYDLILSSSNPSGKNVHLIRTISEALVPGGFFINIQPGDDSQPSDLLNDLEWELWTFEGNTEPKKKWSKNKKFLTDEYQEALLSNGFSIYSISNIPDPYIKEYTVVMLIAEKVIN